MIGSFFKELPPIPETETEVTPISEDLSFRADSDESLLTSLQTVHKILNRKNLLGWASEKADLMQGIALRLLKWRNKNREKSEEMSVEEWQAFAAKTTFNEINRHYKNLSVSELPLDSVEETVLVGSPEGQSEAEVQSLTLDVWQKICSLSLRQRQALLLQSREFVVHLLKCGITDEELAVSLNLSVDEWVVVKARLPLKSFQIADLLRDSNNPKSIKLIAKSIDKARHEARTKVRREIAK